jgi:hypothetical protein
MKARSKKRTISAEEVDKTQHAARKKHGKLLANTNQYPLKFKDFIFLILADFQKIMGNSISVEETLDEIELE